MLATDWIAYAQRRNSRCMEVESRMPMEDCSATLYHVMFKLKSTSVARVQAQIKPWTPNLVVLWRKGTIPRSALVAARSYIALFLLPMTPSWPPGLWVQKTVIGGDKQDKAAKIQRQR